MDYVPKSDWVRLGLWRPLPRYTDRVYFSMDCKPTRGLNGSFNASLPNDVMMFCLCCTCAGECKMYQAHVRRPVLSVKDSLRMIESGSDVDSLTTNKQLRAHVQVAFPSSFILLVLLIVYLLVDPCEIDGRRIS